MNGLVKIKFGYEFGFTAFWATCSDLGIIPLTDQKTDLIRVTLKEDKNFRGQWNGQSALVILRHGKGSDTCAERLPLIIEEDSLEVLGTDFTFYVSRCEFNKLFNIVESYALED